MKLGINWLTAIGVSLASIFLSACGGSGPPPEVRNTAYGAVRGNDETSTSGTYSWKGIPFAKPPVGALRWTAPVEPDAWTGTLVTQAFGNACMQNGRIYGPGANNTYDATIGTTLNTPVGSEDCLTLNIWRPATGETKLPVLVFIYGGSDISGYTADPVYNGANLAKSANAVVVTANYRVGVLGFLNLPQLKTGGTANDASGNFAILDNIQALKFIQGNIANFGGDAGNVTVMGQSAGAINTWALLTSPLTVGLFHKAIPLSGGISLASDLPAGTIPTLNSTAAYLGQGNALLVDLLIADGTAADAATALTYIATRTDTQIAAYMRGKDAATILTTVLSKGLTGSGPIPEGTVVATDPIASITAGNYLKLPLLVGNTANEGKLFAPYLVLLGGPPGMIVTDATRFTMMANYNPDAPSLTDADILNPAYLPVTTPGTGYNAMTDLLASVFTTTSRVNVLTAVKSQQSNVWFYQFNWANEPVPWNDVYGAAHAFDLPFIFGNFGPSLFSNAVNSTANEPGRLALSAAMMSTISAFIRNGDPNNAALGVVWPAWPSTLMFDATLTQAQIVVR
jgi:para-nitrobenzyl esterase